MKTKRKRVTRIENIKRGTENQSEMLAQWRYFSQHSFAQSFGKKSRLFKLKASKIWKRCYVSGFVFCTCVPSLNGWMFSTLMCVWVGISLKSAVTPLIDGLLIVEFWFIKSIVLTVLLPAETGLDTTSLCCSSLLSLFSSSLSLSLSLSLLVIPFDGDGWCLFGQSGEEFLQFTFLQSIYIYTLCVCVCERERRGMQ